MNESQLPSDNESDNEIYMYIIHALCYAVICMVGVAGNSLVIYSVTCFSRMQTVTNIYLLNLAIADVVFLLGVPLLIITILKREFIFGFTMCKIYNTTTSIGQFTTSIFLLIISADRYVAVCHPNYSSKLRTTLISKIVSGVAWLVSIALIYPIFQQTTELVSHTGKRSCIIDTFGEVEDPEFWNNPSTTNLTSSNESNSRKSDESFTISLTVYIFLLSFAIPVFLISVFYGLIVKKLVLSTVGCRTKEMKMSRRRITKLVLIVVTVCIICWLPHWIMQWLFVIEQMEVTR